MDLTLHIWRQDGPEDRGRFGAMLRRLEIALPQITDAKLNVEIRGFPRLFLGLHPTRCLGNTAAEHDGHGDARNDAHQS